MDPEQEPREATMPSQPDGPPAIGIPADEVSGYLTGYPQVQPQRESFPAWSAWDLATIVAFAGMVWIFLSAVTLAVARVAMGADPQQTLTAFREAEAYDGPSLVIAYSHCIAHGYDMKDGLDQQYRAVASGHWPLLRYDPMVRAGGGNPFLLDSPRPRMPLADYRRRELRFGALANADPAEAERLQGLAQQSVNQRWRTYEEMATRGAQDFPADARRER